MPNKLAREQIDAAREKGRCKIEKIVAEWPDNLSANTKQKKLKELYGQRVEPLAHVIENFDRQKYIERHEEPENLRLLLLAAFQGIEETDTICRIMEKNIVDNCTRADHNIVRAFADSHRWKLCRAFYVFSTDGKAERETPTNILRHETALARIGEFPRDILLNLVMPARPEFVH